MGKKAWAGSIIACIACVAVCLVLSMFFASKSVLDLNANVLGQPYQQAAAYLRSLGDVNVVAVRVGTTQTTQTLTMTAGWIYLAVGTNDRVVNIYEPDKPGVVLLHGGMLTA